MTNIAPPELAQSPFQCPVFYTLSIINGKWKPLIIYELFQQTYRFNALKRALPGISQRLLTAQLRELQEAGMVHREVMEVVPPHVEYSLTDRGRSLWPILEAMERWGSEQQRAKQA